MTTYLIDTSGTGWSLSSDTVALHIVEMNRHRTAFGLPMALPITQIADLPLLPPTIDLDWIANLLTAGNLVVFVDLAQTGAATAVCQAGMDYADVVGSLPHGQPHHLVETGGRQTWTATTAAHVADLLSSIDWLIKALAAAGLPQGAPTRRDAHTLSPWWPGHVVNFMIDALARNEAVWTVVLADDDALTLAGRAGLPGIATNGDGKTNLLNSSPAQAAVSDGRGDTLYWAGDPAGHEYRMFAWTDGAGELHSGDFVQLRNNLKRRADSDGPDVARIYALDADARLIETTWNVTYVPHTGDQFRLVVDLPDGGSVSSSYRTATKEK